MKIYNILIVIAAQLTAFGKVPEFAPVFNNGMVLQQGRELTICGKAKPNEKLSLEFASSKISGKAGNDGRWFLKLPAQKATSTPQTMILTGEYGVRKLNDILVGEVWLCSGQSNMYWPLERSLNGKEIAAQSNYPSIRILRVIANPADVPQEKLTARWRKMQPKVAAGMSAVAFYFGRKLHQELKVPIGLICSHRGATMIEPWTPAGAWDVYPEMRDRVYTQFGKVPNPKSKSSKELPQNQPHVLYNGAIHPLTPYAIRGVIWYQGCSNVRYDSQEDYLKKQQALFNSWKNMFKNPTMKFYTVQIAPLNRSQKEAAAHVGIWLAQQRFADFNQPNVKLVITNDVGDLKNIHPENKEPVGLRLANLALKYDYDKDIPADFPRVLNGEVKNETVRLAFSFVKFWKTTDQGEIRNFEIAGPDGKYMSAQVKAEGKYLILTAPGVSNPESVRYLYTSSRLGNLINEEGLPLGTFEMTLKQ